MFVNINIISGISTVIHRLAASNNPYIPDSFDASKALEYLLYIDANNLVIIS